MWELSQARPTVLPQPRRCRQTTLARKRSSGRRKTPTKTEFWRTIIIRSVRQASAKRTLRKDHFRSLLEGTCMLTHPMAQRFELWSLDKLIPFARNPRTHSNAQVAQIAASIAEFGFNNPILVDTHSGIIAGHGRLLAARKLQLEHVPVIVLDHLTESQKRAFILVDNKLAENAGWDEDLLRCELAALEEEDFNLDVIGFDDQELARLLADQEAASGLTDEDAIPEVPGRTVS